MWKKCNKFNTNSKGYWGKLKKANRGKYTLLKPSSINHLSTKDKVVFVLMLSKYTAELTKLLDLSKFGNEYELHLPFD